MEHSFSAKSAQVDGGDIFYHLNLNQSDALS